MIDDSITYREGPIAGELARHCEQLQESPQVVGVGQRHQRWLFDLTRYNFFDFEPLLTVVLSAGSPSNKIYFHLLRPWSSSQVCLTCSSRPRIRSLYILSLEFRLCSNCLRLAACLLCSLSLSAFLSLRVCVWVFQIDTGLYFNHSWFWDQGCIKKTHLAIPSALSLALPSTSPSCCSRQWILRRCLSTSCSRRRILT